MRILLTNTRHNAIDSCLALGCVKRSAVNLGREEGVACPNQNAHTSTNATRVMRDPVVELDAREPAWRFIGHRLVA